MNIKQNQNVKTLALETISLMPIISSLSQGHAGIGTIFMLHSVVKNKRDYLNIWLHNSFIFIERILKYYIKRGVDIISLDDVRWHLMSETSERKNSFVSFCFDDGYRDNLSIALPLFEKYNKPFTIYVTTGMVTRTLNYWWGCLREVIKVNDTIEVEGLNQRFNTRTFKEKCQVYQILRDYSHADLLGFEPILNQLFNRYGVHSADLLDREALSEKEVRVLAKHPLVNIEGHSETHRPLSKLTNEEVRREMLNNKSYLEEITQKEVRHFAYPHGDVDSCGLREFEIAAKLGFQTATTTRTGNLFLEHAQNLTALPRIGFNGNCERIGYIEFFRKGIFSTIESQFGEPKVVTV